MYIHTHTQVTIFGVVSAATSSPRTATSSATPATSVSKVQLSALLVLQTPGGETEDAEELDR